MKPNDNNLADALALARGAFPALQTLGLLRPVAACCGLLRPVAACCALPALQTVDPRWVAARRARGARARRGPVPCPQPTSPALHRAACAVRELHQRFTELLARGNNFANTSPSCLRGARTGSRGRRRTVIDAGRKNPEEGGGGGPSAQGDARDGGAAGSVGAGRSQAGCEWGARQKGGSACGGQGRRGWAGSCAGHSGGGGGEMGAAASRQQRLECRDAPAPREEQRRVVDQPARKATSHWGSQTCRWSAACGTASSTGARCRPNAWSNKVVRRGPFRRQNRG